MSHSLQVRRADAPRGVRGIVSVDGASGRPGRLFPPRGPAGKRSRWDLLPTEADWRPGRGGSGPTVCRLGPRPARPSACQAGVFSACPTQAGSHPLSGMKRRERWGGHPGHDQGRRHSLPRVVAPQALVPVARRSGHRSGCHRAAVWCGPIAFESRDARLVSACDPIKGATSRRERNHGPVPILRRINHDSGRRSHSPARYRDQPWAISISTVNDPLRRGPATVKSTLRRHSVGMRLVVKQEA